MSDANDYRKMAAECQDIANRMSLHGDRERLMQMAERWLRLAADADTRDVAGVSGAKPAIPPHPPHQQQHSRDRS